MKLFVQDYLREKYYDQNLIVTEIQRISGKIGDDYIAYVDNSIQALIQINFSMIDIMGWLALHYNKDPKKD